LQIQAESAPIAIDKDGAARGGRCVLLVMKRGGDFHHHSVLFRKVLLI
jgi:hypothetical protein